MTPKPPPAPMWSDLKRTRQSLIAKRPGDSFVPVVLDGAFQAARQKSNPIRGNLAAAAMRELVSHTLHSIAPDADLTACTWYKQEPKTNGPTRRQRAQYVAHGALLPEYVEDALGIQIDDITKPFLEALNELNKRTHVRPGTIVNRSKDVRWLCLEAMDAAIDLLDAAEECRRAVEDHLRDHIDQAVMDRLIEEQIQELDEISTHTTIDQHQSEEIEIVEIGRELITLSVSGTVDVTLQYGSNSDVRNEIGSIDSDNFPYTAVVKVRTINPTEFVGRIEVKVDNRSFYQ